MADKTTERQNLWLRKDHMAALRALSEKTGVPIIRMIRAAIARFLEENK
jgi:hypothetical protein